MYIDTSDKLSVELNANLRIFATLDRIEHKVNIMAHEIPEIKDNLKLWQDNKLKTSFFQESLNKYWDSINK